jgi:hypothetical protein
MGDAGDMRPNGSVPSRERVEPGSVNIPPLAKESFPTTSTSESVEANKVAGAVIDAVNVALSRKDYLTVASLFLNESGFWRDHLSATWELRTLQSSDKIYSYLKSSATPLTKVEIDTSEKNRVPTFGPIDGWGDVKGIQFYITFETDVGRGRGMVRLAEDHGVWKIFTLSTTLEELKGFEEPTGKRRTKGVKHGGNPERKNWRETRDAEGEFTDSGPKVLIIGEQQSLLLPNIDY